MACQKTASLHEKIAYGEGVPLDWNCGALAEGLACYRRGEFFEAHEHWESLWLTLQEPEKSFLQALIQITAAFHHVHRDHPRGAVSLLRRALGRLETYPSSFGGIQVAWLREQVRVWLQALERGNAPALPDAPRICPIDSIGSADARPRSVS